MAVIQQQPTFNQQAASIAQQKQLAELLRKSADESAQDPNAMVGVGPYRHVVPVHPLAAALRGIESGVSAYMAGDAAKQQGQLEDRRLQATKDAFSGGNLDYGKLADGGMDDRALAQIWLQQQRQQKSGMTGDGYHPPIATSQGYAQFNPETRGYDLIKVGENTLMPGQYDIPVQTELTRVKEGQKIKEYEDQEGRKGFAPAEMLIPNKVITPDFQSSQKPSNLPPVFDFKNPQKAFAEMQGAGIPVNQSDAAQAEFDAFNRAHGYTYGAKGQSTAEKERIKTDAAITEAKAKSDISLEENKAKTQQERVSGAEKTTDTLTDMMRYLYPNGEPVRSNDGRLVPPSQQMILGTGPLDRLQMIGQNVGIHSDQATNTEMLRSKASRLVTDAVNGKLGAGVSNADMLILSKAQGLLDTAQDVKTIYQAVSDIEQTVNRIKQQSQQQPAQGGIKFLGFE